MRLSGKKPDRDIEIAFTGLRPGEKLHEELITQGEGIVKTWHEKIKVIHSDGFFDAYGTQENDLGWLMMNVADLYKLARAQDACAIRTRLHSIVPEYTPGDTECIL